MGLFSSLFSSKPALGKKMGKLCLDVRKESDFLVTTNGASHNFGKFEFSKEVLMLCFGLTLIYRRLGKKTKLASGALLETYINSVPVPETLFLNDTIMLREERTVLDIHAVAPYMVANQFPPQDIGSTPVSTRLMLELAVNLRFPKFAESIGEDISSSRPDQPVAWEATTRLFLSGVMFNFGKDDENFVAARLVEPFSMITKRSQKFLR